MKGLKRKLLETRSELQQRIDAITSEVRRDAGPLSSDWGEQAVETENDQVIDALGNAARREIAQIDRALQRIEDGEYRYCSVCGEPIGDARLELLPYVDRCVECAEELELTGR